MKTVRIYGIERAFDLPFSAVRAEDGKRYIEGYFALYNSATELTPGIEEVIEPGAFADTLTNDIRALYNHDTSMVLGRNTSGTLVLREDAKGLYGKIEIPDTSYANDLHVLVSRGDVTQCSFGFNIVEESTEDLGGGKYRFRIRKIDLHEISVVTFPAYRDTLVHARDERSADVDAINKRSFEIRKQELLKKVRG